MTDDQKYVLAVCNMTGTMYTPDIATQVIVQRKRGFSKLVIAENVTGRKITKLDSNILDAILG